MPDQIPSNLLTYIYELQNVNEQFLNSLKVCLQVFTEIGPLLSDKDGWQNMLKEIQKVIELGDRLYDQRKPN